MSVEEGIRQGKTVITTDSAAMIATEGIDVVLEVTGSPAAGVRHALLVGTAHDSVSFVKSLSKVYLD